VYVFGNCFTAGRDSSGKVTKAIHTLAGGTVEAPRME
jgi:hypothetical protein